MATIQLKNIFKTYENGFEAVKDFNLDIDDNIVVLSTCLNSGEGRYLVQGVLINDEQTK